MATLPTLSRGSLALRAVREEDFDTIRGLLLEPEVARWWGPFDEEAIRRDLLDPSTVFVVEVGGVWAGILLVSEEPDPDYRYVGLDIALATAQHDRGLGRAVLRVAIDHYVRAGHHRFEIDPAVDNEHAIRCYAAVGFRPVGVLRRCERDSDGHWRDNLLMDLLAEELPPLPRME
jgi:aminoglycoside 6'-N-acetyltransferase